MVDSALGSDNSFDAESLITGLGLSRPIFWLNNPLLINYLPSEKERNWPLVFDAVDNWLYHPSYRHLRAEVEASYHSLKREAQLIFTVSRALKEYFNRRQGRVYWIPNGVEARLLEEDCGGDIPPELGGLEAPLLGYVGVIEQRFDARLVAELASRLKRGRVVLVGPIWKEGLTGYQRLLTEERVVLLGFRPYSEITRYIKAFQLCLLPHRLTELTRSMDPLKLYEYLALGRPVVSTPVAGTEKFKGLITIASGVEGFLAAVEQIKKEPAEEEKRREALREETWEQRVKRIMKIIHSLL